MPEHDAHPSPDALISKLRSVAEGLRSEPYRPQVGDDAAIGTLLADLSADYLVPRLELSGMPLVVAVLGQSGSGKSTLINSLAEERVTAEGPLRPTTTRPIAWATADIPATLDGLRRRLPGRVVDAGRALGLVIIDTPPPRIVDDDGHPVAESVAAIADVCVFVASGLRYADAEGWELLASVGRRSVPVLHVLNRLPAAPETARMLTSDFARLLEARGLVPLALPEAVVAVEEGSVDPKTGALPPELVATLRKELIRFTDPEGRLETLQAAMGGSMDLVRRLAADLAAKRRGVGAVLESLSAVTERAYEEEAVRLDDDIVAGRLSDVPATLDLFGTDMAAIVARRASAAARTAASGWLDHPRGAELLREHPGLWSHGEETLEIATTRLTSWTEELEATIATALRRRRARFRRRIAIGAMTRLLDPTAAPPPRVARTIDRIDVVGQARSGLRRALADVLHADADRFRRALGPSPHPPITEMLHSLGVEDA